jgi:D-beta-D-heptose 7-phosphate kinase / D-beta-D-heptose 1-phosphate adenosyltransferase
MFRLDASTFSADRDRPPLPPICLKNSVIYSFLLAISNTLFTHNKPLVKRKNQWHGLVMVIGFVNGCFDLFHAGHLQLLQHASRQCDKLIVAVNDDRSIAKLKGPFRPVVPYYERIEIIHALKCVHYAYIFDGNVSVQLQAVRPTSWFKGIDRTIPDDESLTADSIGIKIVRIPMIQNISTTQRIAHIKSLP